MPQSRTCRSDIFHSVKDRYQDCEEDDDPFSFPSELLDGPTRASFEDDELAIPMEFTEVYHQLLAHESVLATPPEEVLTRIMDLLTSMKSEDAVNTLGEEKNNAIKCLLSESSFDKAKCFAKLRWFHYYLMVESHVMENPDEIVVDISRQGFTAVNCSLHEFFTSIEFSRYVCDLFDAKSTTPPQSAVAVQLEFSVQFEFLEQLGSVVKKEQREDTMDFDVYLKSGVDRSKLRHVGGWAVRKVLNRARKYIQRNVFTKSSSTLARVETQQIACQLIEENVI